MLNTPDSDSSSSSAEVCCTRADADAGNAEAQFALAFFLSASPVPQDYAQAVVWYHKAAEQNHHLAQFNLGQMYAQGQGVPLDDSAALLWMLRAANGGDAGAQFHLGERLSRASIQGSATEAPESRVESYKWYSLAAAQNYRDAVTRSDSATMRMTREEVTEGLSRVKAFVAVMK
jgi:TPR repeat protein